MEPFVHADLVLGIYRLFQNFLVLLDFVPLQYLNGLVVRNFGVKLLKLSLLVPDQVLPFRLEVTFQQILVTLPKLFDLLDSLIDELFVGDFCLLAFHVLEVLFEISV